MQKGTQLTTIGEIRKDLSAMGGELSRVLPRNLTPDKIARIALTTLQTKPELLKCSRQSIIGAIMEAAQLHLVVDGVLGQAYLVPYKSHCQLIAGYKGLMELCRRTGAVKKIRAVCVHDGDEFTWAEGAGDHLYHVPDVKNQDRDLAPVTHVYAIATLEGGLTQHEVWTRNQIDRHKERYSPGHSRSDSSWNTAWPAMAKKTVVRQLAKFLPVSVEAQALIAREEQIEAQVLPIPPTQVRPSEALDQLTDQMDIVAPAMTDAEKEAVRAAEQAEQAEVAEKF